MKRKKWGAILLAVCMIFTMFPTTVMANGDSLAGPDAEKKVIENDLIVQLPSSLDDMIGTSACNGDWLAVAAEPTWEDGFILDYVVPTQEFYDSTGKKLTAADTFQNNSRYTMKMTFQSFESYHGDYYYVLSGENNVYVQYMNGTGEREPMKVTVNKDENGNPIITATYSFSIGTPPEEPEIPEYVTYELAVYGVEFNYHPDRAVSILEEETPYQVSLVRKEKDGTYELVNTNLYTLDFKFEQGDSYQLKSAPHKLDNAYAFSIPSGGDLPVSDKACISAEGTFGIVSWAFPIKAYECQVTRMDRFEVMKQMDVVIGDTMQYQVQLFRTFEGKKNPVSTDSLAFHYNTVYNLDDYLDISCDVHDNYYTISVTGKKISPYERGCDFYFFPASDPQGNGKMLYDDCVDFRFVEPTDIALNQNYDISDKKGQYLYYKYQPSKSGEQYYTLWVEDALAFPRDNDSYMYGESGSARIYTSTDQKPILFWVWTDLDSENANFELIETKQVKEIEILPIPDTILEDIEKNGDQADLRGIPFTVTYADGSTYTHELGGVSWTTSEGDSDPFVVYRMDCRSEGNVYECYPHIGFNNSIDIVCTNPISYGVRDIIELSGCSNETGALGHNFSAWTQTAPTCTENGKKTRTCTKCGKTETASIPAVGHSFGEYKITKQPTALATGTKTRTCTKCGKTESIAIAKLKPIIALSATKLPLQLKKSTTVLKVTKMQTGDKVASFTSSNSKIVTVHKTSGKLTAKKVGKAIITVKLKSGKSAKCVVTVQKTSVKTTKIQVKPSSLKLKKGKKVKLATVLTPLTSQEKVTFTSSNKKIATVSSRGVVTAKKAGKAKITAKSGKKKVTCTITVTAK